MCAMEIENRHCIVWFKDNRWSFFTNEFWLTPKEAKDYGKEMALRNQHLGKWSCMINNIVYNT
jgi:hypothetical protein